MAGLFVGRCLILDKYTLPNDISRMKLRLTVLSGTLSGNSYELENGHILIGRSPNCTVKFDPFKENIISSQHAFVYSGADGFYVRDNSSTNGTYLNGNRIVNEPLNSGDEIVLGKDGITLRVEIEQAGAPVATVEEPAPTEDSGIPSTVPGAAPQIAMESLETSEKVHSEAVDFSQSMSGLGLSSPSVKLPPPQTAKYVAVVIMTILILLASLPVLLVIVLGLGPIPAAIATVAAFMPVALYLAPLIWLDRYDPEPLWLLILCFAWGGVVAVLASAIVNDLVTFAATVSTQSGIIGQIVGAVISAPIIEESMKGLGLLAMLLFFRRHFDDMLDGIVFGGVIALGFAAVENVLYYGQGFLLEGFGGLAVMFVLRGILSPFAHVTFTVMTGIGCGISRESHNWFVRILMPILGLGAAMTLHAIWNGMSIFSVVALEVTGSSPYCSVVGLGGEYLGICGFLVGYTIFEVPLFLIFVGFSLYIMRRQSRTLKEMLAIDVAQGVIPEEHMKIATSLFRSIFWPLGGIFSGKFFNRRRYLRAIGSLGLSYWHIQRATKAQGNTASFQTNPFIRAEVEKYSKLV